jgi:hypothetical protein
LHTQVDAAPSFDDLFSTVVAHHGDRDRLHDAAAAVCRRVDSQLADSAVAQLLFGSAPAARRVRVLREHVLPMVLVVRARAAAAGGSVDKAAAAASPRAFTGHGMQHVATNVYGGGTVALAFDEAMRACAEDGAALLDDACARMLQAVDAYSNGAASQLVQFHPDEMARATYAERLIDTQYYHSDYGSVLHEAVRTLTGTAMAEPPPSSSMLHMHLRAATCRVQAGALQGMPDAAMCRCNASMMRQALGVVSSLLENEDDEQCHMDAAVQRLDLRSKEQSASHVRIPHVRDHVLLPRGDAYVLARPGETRAHVCGHRFQREHADWLGVYLRSMAQKRVDGRCVVTSACPLCAHATHDGVRRSLHALQKALLHNMAV